MTTCACGHAKAEHMQDEHDHCTQDRCGCRVFRSLPLPPREGAGAERFTPEEREALATANHAWVEMRRECVALRAALLAAEAREGDAREHVLALDIAHDLACERASAAEARAETLTRENEHRTRQVIKGLAYIAELESRATTAEARAGEAEQALRAIAAMDDARASWAARGVAQKALITRTP